MRVRHFFCLGFSQGWVCGGEKAEQNQTDGVAAGTALVAAGTVDIKCKLVQTGVRLQLNIFKLN